MAIFGCIADDFTGAGDMASFLAQGGMHTVLYNGVPAEPGGAEGEDAAVVALKTRTQETDDAVAASLEALEYLRGLGCTHFYVKYCSTFDSTPRGNIGPICDAVMERLQARFTLLCPALPVNGRTVRDGKLFVNGVPLQESPMKNHPLTPMWDSDLERLMSPQSRYPVYRLSRSFLETEHPDEHYYLVPDCEDEADLESIAARFGALPLLTGGSGLAYPLARLLSKGGKGRAAALPEPAGGSTLLLAGSCSEATRVQIDRFRASGGACFHLSPEQLLGGGWDFEAFWGQVRRALERGSALVYTSETPEQVRSARRRWGEVSGALEEGLASLAERARAEGVGKFIVAGGETSGAVTRRLGMGSYRIGRSVAPGVPVMIPLQAPQMRVVLKSGNFGQPDFFERAVALLAQPGGGA